MQHIALVLGMIAVLLFDAPVSAQSRFDGVATGVMLKNTWSTWMSATGTVLPEPGVGYRWRWKPGLPPDDNWNGCDVQFRNSGTVARNFSYRIMFDTGVGFTPMQEAKGSWLGVTTLTDVVHIMKCSSVMSVHVEITGSSTSSSVLSGTWVSNGWTRGATNPDGEPLQRTEQQTFSTTGNPNELLLSQKTTYVATAGRTFAKTGSATMTSDFSAVYPMTKVVIGDPVTDTSVTPPVYLVTVTCKVGDCIQATTDGVRSLAHVDNSWYNTLDLAQAAAAALKALAGQRR